MAEAKCRFISWCGCSGRHGEARVSKSDQGDARSRDARFRSLGFLSPEKLREVYYASHIFLHPSETGSDGNQEGIPNSMLEAMATGLPVFATDHGGIPEAIENGVSGILVPERDHEALSQALLQAVQDRHLLARLARNGAAV